MEAENDNRHSALSPDGIVAVVVDRLDRQQIETLLLYLFGLVDVIESIGNHMVCTLVSKGQLCGAQLAVLKRWKEAMDEVASTSAAEIEQIASKPSIRPKRATRLPIESDRELSAYVVEVSGALTLNEIHAACAEKFGKGRTPTKAALRRFLLQISKAGRSALN